MDADGGAIESVFGVSMHAIAWVGAQVKKSDPECTGMVTANDIERWANGYQPTYTEGFNLGYKLATDHAIEAILNRGKRVKEEEA